MSYYVSPAGGEIKLHETDPVQEVLQNVAIILATKVGSCPMYRQFGIEYDFLDRPIIAARPMLLAAIRDGVEQFEPRAEVIGIEMVEEEIDKVTWRVEVNIREKS